MGPDDDLELSSLELSSLELSSLLEDSAALEDSLALDDSADAEDSALEEDSPLPPEPCTTPFPALPPSRSVSRSPLELSWDSGEGWLSASCHTATQNGDIYGSLRSASAAQAEEISAARSLPAQSLGIWQYHLSENSLTAWTEVGEDTILFEYSADPAQEDGSVESELKRALEWLKTAAVS